MADLRCHYFNSIYEWWIDWHYTTYGKSPLSDQLEKLKISQKASSTRFKTFILDKLKDKFLNDYHLFIISQPQDSRWEYVCEKYNLKKYIIYKSDTVHNLNYATNPPRLTMFILKFPTDYKIEVNVMDAITGKKVIEQAFV